MMLTDGFYNCGSVSAWINIMASHLRFTAQQRLHIQRYIYIDNFSPSVLWRYLNQLYGRVVCRIYPSDVVNQNHRRFAAHVVSKHHTECLIRERPVTCSRCWEEQTLWANHTQDYTQCSIIVWVTWRVVADCSHLVIHQVKVDQSLLPMP